MKRLEKMKRCPFCGSEAELYGECYMVKVRCTNYNCQAQIGTWYDEPEDAIAAWNQRQDKEANA